MDSMLGQGIFAIVMLFGAAACSSSASANNTAGQGAPSTQPDASINKPMMSANAATTGAPGPEVDAAAVASATGAMPQTTGHIVKVSFPRSDMPISVDQWNAMPPFMGLTSYAAFTPTLGMGNDVAVMGDVVLLQDEVNPALSAALNNGLEVTALHNHFFFDSPHVYFMHIGGHGPVATLAAGVKAVLDAQKAVRAAQPMPADSFGAAMLPAMSAIDGTALDKVFAIMGTSQNGMYKASFPRTITSEMCGGCTLKGSESAAIGIYTWAAFGGNDDNAAVDGDFAATDQELQPVLKALRSGGINIVSIHHHMTGDSPRLVFLHYWGRGPAAQLAAAVKAAVDLTAWDGKAK